MTIQDETLDKIRQLPDSVAQEVDDFIEFLLTRRDRTQWQLWTQFLESLEIAGSDFADYLPNLQDYENRLARGEIKW